MDYWKEKIVREFRANVAAAAELSDLDTVIVALAESDDGEGARLEISRSLTFDEQDAKLGMDTYCLADESGATHYGGVTGWSLLEGMLEIRIDGAAEHELHVLGGFRIDVAALEASEMEPVLVAIQRLLGPATQGP